MGVGSLDGFGRSEGGVAAAVGVFLVGVFGHLGGDFDFDFFVFGGCRCCSGCVGGIFLYVVLRHFVVVKLVVVFCYLCFCGTVMDLAGRRQLLDPPVFRRLRLYER